MPTAGSLYGADLPVQVLMTGGVVLILSIGDRITAEYSSECSKLIYSAESAICK
jgi:hypothetical protein